MAHSLSCMGLTGKKQNVSHHAFFGITDDSMTALPAEKVRQLVRGR